MSTTAHPLPTGATMRDRTTGRKYQMHNRCAIAARADDGDLILMVGPDHKPRVDQAASCEWDGCETHGNATTEPTTEPTTTEEPTMSTTAPHTITTDARKLATVLAYVKRAAGGVTVSAVRTDPSMGTITISATARTLTITHTGHKATTETHLEATTDSAGWDAEWAADVPLAALTDAARAAGTGSLTITRTPDGMALTVASSGQESAITTIRPDDKAAAIPAPDLSATDAAARAARIAKAERRAAEGMIYGRTAEIVDRIETRADEHPGTPRTTQDSPVILDGPTMAATITHGAAGAGSDDTLPMLTGSKIEVAQGGAVTMASSDRFRLSVAEATPAARAAETSALAPAKWLTDTAKFMAKDDAVALSIARRRRDDGTIPADDYWITMAGDTTTSSARLIDAEFPKFRRLMRADADTDARFTTDAAALVKLIKPWAKDSFVDLIVDPDGTVAAERRPHGALDGPPMARATIDAGDVHAAAAVRIRLDARYLASLLATAPRGSKAVLRIDSPQRPIMISHPGGAGLLMPIRIGG